MTSNIEINPAKQIIINATKIKVQNIGVASNGSGNWNISFALETLVPTATSQPGLSFNQMYNANGNVTVTRDEILSALGLNLSSSILDVTLGDIETAVTTIALDKLYTSLGW